MNARAQVRELMEHLGRNLWIRFLVSIITAITAYLEFRNAGWTPLFWGLCALTLVVALLIAVPLVHKRLQERQMQWLGKARLLYDHQHKVETLTTLIEEFATLEKAKYLAETLKDKRSIRVLAVLPVERMLGVILNIGKENDLQVGTQLLVYRTDEYTPNGKHIEEPLGLVQVTYVQAENNCSQAVVVDRQDRDFWDQATAQLKRERRITPPINFAVPYIPYELNSLSSGDLGTFQRYLETIRNSLTCSESDIMTEEEALL